MDFRFDLQQLFRTPIVRINNSLIPNGFHGDRRSALEATAKIAEIINEVGQESARAQGLTNPVTTSEKLRNSDHNIYLLSEHDGKTGLVTGLLKIGEKSLYVHDSEGVTRHITAPCVLDFFVHESRQRSGYGKLMFEYMLNEENVTPDKLAIDRPSEKLLRFLSKHYGLDKAIPQMNNFVVFEGFFDTEPHLNGGDEITSRGRMHVTASPNTNLFGPQFTVEKPTNNRRSHSLSHVNDIPTHLIQQNKVGRYAANKPSSTMSQIIHNTPAEIKPELNSANTTFIDYDGHHIHFNDDSNVVYNDHHEGIDVEEDAVHADEEEFVMHNLKNLQLTLNVPHFHGITKPDTAIRAAIIDHDEHHDEVDHHHHHQHHHSPNHDSHHENEGHHSTTPAVEILRKPVHFQHTKQHTGLKNVSRNVGLAVSPGAKMEFDQEINEGFGSVKINRPIGGLKSHLGSGSHEHLNDAESTSSRESESSRLTEQGFVDLKFYHNKLW